jgi:hypothetical protein
MKTSRLLLASTAIFMVTASCNKSRSPVSKEQPGESADDLAAERALVEDERLAWERERLQEERDALDAEKQALRAEREARLAAREHEVESAGLSLEERQWLLEEREMELRGREDDLATREATLSEQELGLAGRDFLDGWEPEPLPVLQEPVGDYSNFYEDLQPYGSWYETPDYGYVYQPTVVVQDRSWRPYTRGRWACTNLGWNWVSDEPFGWACFHYGRWALLDGRGWVWVPGDEWAPSWVCWREGSEHVGWAPLPPETLGFRGRGWDRSVESEFGIGAACFNFVHRRHMADPPWRHCLPVGGNARLIGQTNNITNIRFHQNRYIAGGPGYERLRREVGKPWPVYEIKKDRLEAIRDRQRRNPSIQGNRLAVFAPNLGARWNGSLKPSAVAGRWDQLKVVRAESGIKPQWAERYREMRVKRNEEVATPDGGVGRAKQLEENRRKVGEAQRELLEKQRQLTESRRGKQSVRREALSAEARKPASSSSVRPAGEEDPDASRKAQPETVARVPSLVERQRQAAERLRESRARRSGVPVDEARPVPENERGGGSVAGNRDREPSRISRQPVERTPAEPQVVRPGEADEEARPLERPIIRNPRDANDDGSVAANERQARIEEARRQQQAEALRQRSPSRGGPEPVDRRLEQQEAQRQQQEQNRQRQQQARDEAEENSRRGRMEEVRQQQQEAARLKAEQARQEQSERQSELEAARARQVEEARARQEQARREAEENGRRQQQEEMRRQQQEQARQQQEERARQLQEERARQQEQMRQQQEEAQRRAEERARQQQEERARQQEERARQQEQARQQQEERARQQEQARQQQREEQQRRQEERVREQRERQQEPRQGRR